MKMEASSSFADALKNAEKGEKQFESMLDGKVSRLENVSSGLVLQLLLQNSFSLCTLGFMLQLLLQN
jgi:hypothetical protein